MNTEKATYILKKSRVSMKHTLFIHVNEKRTFVLVPARLYRYLFSHDNGRPLDGRPPGHLQQQSLQLARHRQLLIGRQAELGRRPQNGRHPVDAGLGDHNTHGARHREYIMVMKGCLVKAAC